MMKPALACLLGTQIHVNAACEGKSLSGLPHCLAERELEQWAFFQGCLEKDWPRAPSTRRIAITEQRSKR